MRILIVSTSERYPDELKARAVRMVLERRRSSRRSLPSGVPSSSCMPWSRSCTCIGRHTVLVGTEDRIVPAARASLGATTYRP